MKMTMAEVLMINSLYPVFQEKKMPIKIAYKFSKLFGYLRNEVDFYYKSLNKIIDEYAEKDENGELIFLSDESIKLKPEYISRFKEETDSLLAIEVTIPDIKFNLEEMDGIELNISEVTTLSKFIED